MDRPGLVCIVGGLFYTDSHGGSGSRDKNKEWTQQTKAKSHVKALLIKKILFPPQIFVLHNLFLCLKIRARDLCVLT